MFKEAKESVKLDKIPEDLLDLSELRKIAEEEAEKKEAETRQREAETRQREAETRQREAETRQREVETRQREVETRQREAETRQREAETRQREAETRQREEEEASARRYEQAADVRQRNETEKKQEREKAAIFDQDIEETFRRNFEEKEKNRLESAAEYAKWQQQQQTPEKRIKPSYYSNNIDEADESDKKVYENLYHEYDNDEDDELYADENLMFQDMKQQRKYEHLNLERENAKTAAKAETEKSNPNILMRLYNGFKGLFIRKKKNTSIQSHDIEAEASKAHHQQPESQEFFDEPEIARADHHPKERSVSPTLNDTILEDDKNEDQDETDNDPPHFPEIKADDESKNDENPPPFSEIKEKDESKNDDYYSKFPYQKFAVSKDRGLIITVGSTTENLVFYTDGSYKKEKKLGGIGVYVDDPLLEESFGMAHPCTDNNHAELTAVEYVIKEARNWEHFKDQAVIIRTNSEVVFKKFKSNSTDPEIQALIRIASSYPKGIEIQHVYSHCGISGNEKADGFASMAVNEDGNPNKTIERKKRQNAENSLHLRKHYILPDKQIDDFKSQEKHLPAGRLFKQVQYTFSTTNSRRINYYKEDPVVTSRSTNEVMNWFTNNKILYNYDPFVRPVMELNEAGFTSEIIIKFEEIYGKQISNQHRICWPLIMAGSNVNCSSPSGDGRTLSYLLPAIMHSINHRFNSAIHKPLVLLLVENDYMASKVEKIAVPFSKSTCVTVANIVVKEPKQYDICITTVDHLIQYTLEKKYFENCLLLIVDRIDRIMELHGKKTFQSITSKLPEGVQTVYFSAAAFEVQTNTARLDFCKKLYFVSTIEQNVEVIDEEKKKGRLIEIMNGLNKTTDKVVIFVNNKNDEIQNCGGADVFKQFEDSSPVIIQDFTFFDWNNKKFNCVIIFDYPENSNDYAHRICCAGIGGKSYTFVTGKDLFKCNDLVLLLKKANQKIPEKLAHYAKIGGGEVQQTNRKRTARNDDDNGKPKKVYRA